MQQYSLASDGAGGILAEELRQKVQLAHTLERRQLVEWAAWLLVLGAFAYFLLRALRGRGPLRPPIEAVYVLPVYLLLILGALGRDELVVRALLYSAACSLLLIGAAGLAARRAPPRGSVRWLQALLLVAANAALFYAVLNRTGLVDKLIMTAQM